MDKALHARAKEVFLAVQALPRAQWEAALDRECADDAALRREVESLLAHHRDDSILGETARTAPPHVVQVTFGQGATAKWNEEQRHLLHQRVRLWALVLHLLIIVMVFRAFSTFGGIAKLGPGTVLGFALGGLTLLLLGLRVLFLRSPSLLQLRRLEVLLTASAATMIVSWSQAWLTQGAQLALPPPVELQELFRDAYWVLWPDHTARVQIAPSGISYTAANYWTVISGLYCFIIPNSRRRGITMALLLTAASGATIAAGALSNPILRPYAVGNFVSCVSMVGAFSALLLYVSLRFQALRLAVFEAREVGQYRLTRLLGKGAMGEVYFAQHRLLQRPCAVKLIRPEQAGSEDWLRRFEREVQATAQLTHPNTVEVYDFGRTDDGSFFCAMEYLPGMTLDALVREHGPLPPERAVYLLRQVCGALAEAHRKGLVHRDVKPGNIFASERGGAWDFVKLLDFGLVLGQVEVEAPASTPASAPELERQGPHLTRVGQLLGTPAYMAPEQLRGERPDARSDIYGLGGVACFLLTGRPPFERETLEQLLDAHLSAPVPRLRDRNPELPAELDAIVARCLAKDRDARFQSVAEIAAALAATPSAGQWDGAKAEAWWQAHLPPAEPEAVAGSTGTAG